MARTPVLVLSAALCAAMVARGDVLFENGGFVTHPGEGFNGADASRADPAFLGIGNFVYLLGTGPAYRGSDDFTVPSPGWTLQRVRVHAFIEGASMVFPPESPFTWINMRIWDGEPEEPGSQIVATSETLVATGWTGAYRTSATNLLQNTRPIMFLDAGFQSLFLPAGTYWIDFQVSGENAITPYVMDGLVNADGNARVRLGLGWHRTTYGNPPRGIAYPFSVHGEGSSQCYANCDQSTVAPILNVEDFTCFINRFAEAQALPHEQQIGHYANCDGSTIAPVLNVEDFTCFINAFAAGCP
jgi:hypothetical protein